jgi:hypothetical protein
MSSMVECANARYCSNQRTTGSVEPYADLNLRDRIDAGMPPGRIST